MKKFGVRLDEIGHVFVQFRHPDQQFRHEFARDRVEQMCLNCARNAAHNASQLIKAEIPIKKGHHKYYFLWL
jgi:hypothetical protein